MSTPSPFRIPQDHKDLIDQFMAMKAAEDGLESFEQLLDQIFEFWLLLTDRDLLEQEVEFMEIEKLEDVEVKQAESTVIRRDRLSKLKKKKKKKKKRSTKKKAKAAAVARTPTENEDRRAATRVSKRKPAPDLPDPAPRRER